MPTPDTPEIPEAPRSAAPNPRRRLLGLLACLGAGGGVAVIGNSFLEHQAWALAIPAAVAVGWLFVANPCDCDPTARRQ